MDSLLNVLAREREREREKSNYFNQIKECSLSYENSSEIKVGLLGNEEKFLESLKIVWETRTIILQLRKALKTEKVVLLRNKQDFVLETRILETSEHRRKK